jgi:hypothetical protein
MGKERWRERIRRITGAALQAGAAPRSRLIKSKRFVSKIMNELSLPKDTRVLADDHYRCPKCFQKKLTRQQEEKDWEF